MSQESLSQSISDARPSQAKPGTGTLAENPEKFHPPADWQATIKQPVFTGEDSFLRSGNAAQVTWSIAWSDLMMTMFILFLSLFIYQLAHRQFLDQEEVEIVAGSSTSLPPSTLPGEIIPFHPISPQLSKKGRHPLQQVELLEKNSLPADDPLPDTGIPVTISEQPPQREPPAPEYQIMPEEPLFEGQTSQEKGTAAIVRQDAPGKKTLQQQEVIAEIYDLSKVTLEKEKLDRFASVELIPDKAMRIILTGDLLFATGRAELTERAQQSLQKLSPVIAKTPYMINVVGHTDSVPMHSGQFPSNWELSVARASRVARFLIEDIGVPGKQIVVSGFSYFRPLRPNDTAKNRSINRRVEIILSKESPPATRPST